MRGLLLISTLLDDSGLLESGVSAELGDGADAAGRYVENEGLLELRDVDTLLLEVRILAYHASRIELRRTGAVRVPAGDDRSFFGYCADFCHIVICELHAIIQDGYMQGVNTFFYIVVLILSVAVHEAAHGFAADSQGDPTARYAGRLTMNPLKHLDLVGSILLPLLLVVFHAGFLIGWAKPVPYTEANLRNKRWGTILVAGAGVMVNILLALIFGLGIRFAFIFGSFAPAFVSIAAIITLVNIVLALFNLIPIPPLDGSKILFALLGARGYRFQRAVEYLSLPLLLVFVFVFWPEVVSPLVTSIFSLITGL